MVIETALLVVALVLAFLELITTRGKAGPTNWAIVLVCIALLLPRF